MNNKMVNFKIDTGAGVTAVPKSLMQVLPSLFSTDKTLRGLVTISFLCSGKLLLFSLLGISGSRTQFMSWMDWSILFLENQR